MDLVGAGLRQSGQPALSRTEGVVDRLIAAEAGVVHRRFGRPRVLGLVGFLAASGLVVAVGRAGTAAAYPLVGTWGGVLPRVEARGMHRILLTAAVFTSMLVLICVWSLVVRAAARQALTPRSALGLLACWAMPFAVGPPLASRDIYSYAAQGTMVVKGLSPYRGGPADLGAAGGALLHAVDARWAHTPAPYGPLSLWLQSLAARIPPRTGLATVIGLRVLVVCSVAAMVLIAIRLAAPRPAAAVIALLALNPVVLLHLVSGAHLEAVMVALLLGGLLLRRQGHLIAGMALVTAAGLVKAPALLAVGVLVALDVAKSTSWRERVRVAARDVGTAAVILLALSRLIPDGWGWLKDLNAPAMSTTNVSPAIAVGGTLHWLLHALGSGLSAAGTRKLSEVIFAAVALLLLARLVLTVRRRDPLRTVGFGLLVLGVFGPVTHPWYLLWGFACLAPAAAGGAVKTRALILVMSGMAALLELPSPRGAVDYAVMFMAGGLSALVALIATAWPPWPRLPGWVRVNSAEVSEAVQPVSLTR